MSWEKIPVGLEEMYLGGTVESWKSCFGHTEMTGKENGSPLPISLQKKLVFKNGFQQRYRDVILSRETISHSL